MASPMTPPFVLAIVGGSASGKTELAKALVASLPPERAVLVREDDYYRCSSDVEDFDPAAYNFDEPAAKDQALLAAHLVLARMGRSFDRPDYDFSVHRRRAETVKVAPAPLIVLEGLHLMTSPVLASHFDAVVFVDTAEPVRLARRIARDMAERDRTLAFVEQQFRDRVAPMHALHVDPQKDYATLVLNGEHPLSTLVTLVRTLLPEWLKA